MRPIHKTLEATPAIAAAPFPLRTGASDRGNKTGFEIYLADGVVLGVHDVDIAVGTQRNSLRAIECPGLRRSPVSRESLLPAPGDVHERAAFQIQLPDAVTFTKR